MVRKKSLPSEQKRMSPTVFVDQASEWANHLVRRESRGPGDIEDAMRRIEARYGLPYSVLWSLRYRRPKDLMVSVYAHLQSVYVAEIDRQQRLLAHEREITEAKTWLGRALVRAADKLSGSEDGVVK